jgi:hypothetical protein
MAYCKQGSWPHLLLVYSFYLLNCYIVIPYCDVYFASQQYCSSVHKEVQDYELVMGREKNCCDQFVMLSSVGPTGLNITVGTLSMRDTRFFWHCCCKLESSGVFVLYKQIPEGDVPTAKFLNVNFTLCVAWNWSLSFSPFFYILNLPLYTHFVIKFGTIQIIVTRTKMSVHRFMTACCKKSFIYTKFIFI